MGLGYRELPAPASLAAAVACVWRSHDGAVRVLPDACVDVVLSADRLIVAGPATEAHLVAAAPGRARCGVRLRTGAAGAGLGLDAAQLLDRDVRLDELWGAAGRRLEEQVLEADSPPAALMRGLAGRLADVAPDPVVRHAAALLSGGLTVRRAAAAVALSERQLRRRFDLAVGYGPATLLRVQRFQRFLRLARADGAASLARLAVDAGYADQAHLSRECRRLAGLAPAALLAAGATPAGESGTADPFKLVAAEPATMGA